MSASALEQSVAFMPGDTVECVIGCENGNGERVRKGETFTVRHAGPHPIFPHITMLFLRCHSETHGFRADHFRRL